MPVTMTSPLDPGGPESCAEGLHAAYQTMPDAFKMSQGHRWLHEGTREWDSDLLIEQLREIAALRNAHRILEKAAVAYYWTANPAVDPNRPRVAQALADATADLAVTGRAAYATFQRGGGGSGTQDSDISASAVRTLLQFQNSSHTPGDSAVTAAIRRAVDRAYTVAWAIRGPAAHRRDARPPLGWLAVSALHDPPHRPVNVPSVPYPYHQNEIVISVPVPYWSDTISLAIRYIIVAEGLREREQTFSSRTPVIDHPARIPPDYDVIVFVHGHSSRAEEAMDLAPKLLEKARNKGRKLAIIAFDLPSNGYSEMIDHEQVAAWGTSNYNTAYPALEFIEEAIVQFVERLSALAIINRDRIVAVIGGSLGGNMALRLSRRDFGRYPWLKQVVAWSPASTWGRSWALARLDDPPGELYHDFAKHEAVRVTRDRMKDAPSPTGEDRLNKRREYFDSVFDPTLLEEVFAILSGSPSSQPGRWYSDVWPCKSDYIRGAYLDRHEIYNDAFRRWHWRVAHEQLIFMHEERMGDGLSYSYDLVRSRLLLAAGAEDDNEPDELYSNTREFARLLRNATGTTLWLENTGHSIHSERPGLFADAIVKFLRFPASVREASWMHAHDASIEHPDRLESIWRAGFYIRLNGKPAESTWLHFAVPTPVVVDDERLRAGSVMLRYRTGTGAHIEAVHTYDGEHRVAVHGGLEGASADWRFQRLDLAGQPAVRWGLGVSIEVVFSDEATTSDARSIEISSVGCDFLA